MMKATVSAVTRFLREGFAAATETSPYDGMSAVIVDANGMVRLAIPVRDPMFALTLEVGGRAMNLLFPYHVGICCGHGFVREEHLCGLQPIDSNPPRNGSV